jgi:hypothetical protein
MRLSDVWVGFIGLLFIGFIGFVVYGVVVSEEDLGGGCIDVNRAAGFLYDVCYDSLSGNVLMLVEGNLEYEVVGFGVEFIDSSGGRKYDLVYEDVDLDYLYRFGASSNPEMINLTLGVVEVFDLPVCDVPRVVSVKDCLTKNPGWGKGSVNGTVVEYGKYDVEPVEYDISEYNVSLLDEFWSSICVSNWSCGEWEECVEGYQYRDCVDLNGCYAALNVPNTVQICGEVCFEDWVCEWGDCVNGMMNPNCYDKNDCGTKYIFPPNVSCDFGGECVPDIVCSEWSSCDINYDFESLIGNGTLGISGVRSRVCRDSNDCVESLVDVKSCSVGEDVYTETFIECGGEYVGVYDANSDELVARIESSGSEVNIYFDAGNSICEHCYDGAWNYDEEGIDCGGSCVDCEV